jgi:hypothetical protein
MPTEWRTISRSVRGQAHVADGLPCQDSSRVEVLGADSSGILVACVADGAGSAPRSHIGSRLVCQTIFDCVSGYCERSGSIGHLTLQVIQDWCDSGLEVIGSEARESDRPVREFATTLCAAILGPSGSCFFQIGDGAIVLQSGEVCGAVFWPDSGEYVNTTTFITSHDYREHLKFYATERNYSDVALFTDGIERLALQFDTLTPHLPFFTPLFQALRTLENWQSLEAQLEVFLTSESVCNRSDDDKSLIIATRVDE